MSDPITTSATTTNAAAQPPVPNIEQQIQAVYYTTAAKAVADAPWIPPNMHQLALCILVMRNGFMVVGKSAPLWPANFDALAHRRLAYQDALRQLGPLTAYALRDRAQVPSAP